MDFRKGNAAWGATWARSRSRKSETSPMPVTESKTRREKETDRRQEDHQVGAAPQVGDLGLQAPKPEEGGRHEEADEGAQGHHHENQAAGMSQQP